MLVGVPMPKPIFRMCSHQDDLELTRCWGLSGNSHCHRNAFKIMGFNFMGVPQPKPMQGFTANFQNMFTQEDLELISFFGGGIWATIVAIITT